MRMIVCPLCKSPRIRNDYKPAPIWLRLLGIRALLCDYCNHQFRAFALRAPRSGRPRHAKRIVATPADTPGVDLVRLRQNVAEAQSEKSRTINRMKLSLRPAPSGEVVAGQELPVRKEIQTQILKLHAPVSNKVVKKGHEEEQASAQPMPPCSECGARNVRRRRRTSLERATLALAGLKAFNCQDCGASFFARLNDGPGETKTMSGRMFDSSALNAGHER